MNRAIAASPRNVEFTVTAFTQIVDSKIVRKPANGPAVIAATLSLNLLALVLPIVVLQLFDRVIPYAATESLFFLFLGLCAATVFEFVLKWARIVLLTAEGERFETELSAHFLKRTLNAKPDQYRKTTTAEHLDRFGAIAQLRSYYSGQGRILAIDLPFTAVFVVLIGLIGGWLVLVPIASCILLLMFKIALQHAQTTIFDKRNLLDARRYSFLIEVLGQISTVKANTMEPQMVRRYELLQDQTVDISRRLIKFTGFSQSFGALFSQLSIAAMGLYGGYLIIQGNIGIAELAACMLLNGRTTQPLLKLLGQWAQSENVAASMSKIGDAVAIEQTNPKSSNAASICGHIKMQNVRLKHPTRTENLFTGVDLDLLPGQVLAILGADGAGKSSFMRLLLAEQTATEGRVLIDGRPPAKIADLRGENGLVYIDHSQVVFPGSILDNISAFGDGDAKRRALALSTALGLEQTVHRLPLGYNSQIQSSPEIANNPAFLQLASIIRALTLRPKILLLNNVTTALDSKTCDAVAAELAKRKGEMTIILASRDDRLLQLSDAFIQLDPDQSVTTEKWVEDVSDTEFENAARLARPQKGAA